MALINQLKQGYKEKESVHKEIEGTYFIVTAKNGKKYLQIDTYGSEDRKYPGKISQSLQFSHRAIEQLKKILAEQF